MPNVRLELLIACFIAFLLFDFFKLPEIQIGTPTLVVTNPMSIYNHLGKLVYQTQENQSQGNQLLIWNAESYPEGVYFYRLQVGDGVANGKVLKVR